MSMPEWTFLSNHTHVLVCISRDPSTTMREVAAQVGVTERAVQRIIGDLDVGGYLERHREGRRNRYTVHLGEHLRHPLEEEVDLGTLLAALGGSRGVTGPPSGSAR